MLFVYGTLLSGLDFPMHDELVARARLVDRGWVAGRLIEISWYPGLIEDCGEVSGELYQPFDEAATLAFLDRYEGCHEDDPLPHEYRRTRKPVRPASGDGVVEAWVYEYQGRIDGRREIGGDFRAWVQGRHGVDDSRPVQS